MNTRKRIAGLALAAISTAACVHDEDVQLDEEISTIIWDPGSEIVARHATWHLTKHPGDEFLDFHAQILVDMRAVHVAARRAASEREPWARVPDAIRNNPSFSQTRRDQLVRLESENPAEFCAGQSYRQFGQFIQSGVHGPMHTVLAQLLRTDGQVAESDTIRSAGVSPRSTLFFQIHGLIDNWRLKYLELCQ